MDERFDGRGRRKARAETVSHGREGRFAKCLRSPRDAKSSVVEPDRARVPRVGTNAPASSAHAKMRIPGVFGDRRGRTGGMRARRTCDSSEPVALPAIRRELRSSESGMLGARDTAEVSRRSARFGCLLPSFFFVTAKQRHFSIRMKFSHTNHDRNDASLYSVKKEKQKNAFFFFSSRPPSPSRRPFSSSRRARATWRARRAD